MGNGGLKLEKNKDINVRASTIPSIYGENLVMRLLDTSSGIYSLERIGMAAGDRKKVEDMILNKIPAHEITRTAINSGQLTPLKDNAMEKVVRGITTFEEAASAVMN